MAFTYDISTDRGKVRRLIGDTNSADALFQDDEIDFFLDQAGSGIYQAAAYACEALAAEFGRKSDTTVEAVSVQYSQRATAYSRMALRFAATARRAYGSAPSPAISGISKDAINTQRENTDRVQSKFYMDRFSNPPGSSEDDYFLSRSDG